MYLPLEIRGIFVQQYFKTLKIMKILKDLRMCMNVHPEKISKKSTRKRKEKIPCVATSEN